MHPAHLFCQGAHGSDTLPVSFPSGKGRTSVQRSHCWRLLHSQLTLCDRKKEGEVPDRINGTYFETKILKLCYIKCTCESKLVSYTNELAAVD